MRIIKLKLTSLVVMLLIVICLSHQTQADPVTTTVEGDTTGAPTFNRPGALIENDRDLAPFTPTVLSGFQVRYNVVSFTVSVDGSYSFLPLAEFNSYLLLYQDSFDPASPLTNVLLARDDSDEFKIAFSAMLLPGVTYFAVITGSRPGDFGAYHSEVQGPGAINVNDPPIPTPEPATLALLATGLSGIGAAVRRRRRRSTATQEPGDGA